MVQQVGDINNSVLNDVNVNKNNIRINEKVDKKIYHHKGIYLMFLMSSVLSIFAIFIHFVDVDTVSYDNYIGIVVALMGVLATFIVGFQIYNSIEYKSEIQTLQKMQKKYEAQFKEMESRLNYESNEAYIGIYIVQGITFKDKSINASLKSFLKSIIYSLNVADIKRANVAIFHIKSLAENKKSYDDALGMNGVKCIVEEIKTHINYKFVEDQLDILLK